MILKLLCRKFLILLITTVIYVSISNFLYAKDFEETKSVGIEYFPFDPKTKLTYETTFGETTCITKPDGEGFVQEFRSDDFEMNQRLIITDNKYCVIDIQQKIDVFLFITHSVDVTYSEPARLVGLPLKQDEKWEWTGIEYIDGNIDTLFVTTEYAGDELLITPAGEFNCKKI